MRSLAATLFLAASLYVVAVADSDSMFSATVAVSFIIAIVVCLYFSYRLLLIVNHSR